MTTLKRKFEDVLAESQGNAKRAKTGFSAVEALEALQQYDSDDEPEEPVEATTEGKKRRADMTEEEREEEDQIQSILQHRVNVYVSKKLLKVANDYRYQIGEVLFKPKSMTDQDVLARVQELTEKECNHIWLEFIQKQTTGVVSNFAKKLFKSDPDTKSQFPVDKAEGPKAASKARNSAWKKHKRRDSDIYKRFMVIAADKAVKGMLTAKAVANCICKADRKWHQKAKKKLDGKLGARRLATALAPFMDVRKYTKAVAFQQETKAKATLCIFDGGRCQTRLEDGKALPGLCFGHHSKCCVKHELSELCGGCDKSVVAARNHHCTNCKNAKALEIERANAELQAKLAKDPLSFVLSGMSQPLAMLRKT